MKELHAGYISSSMWEILDELDPALDWHVIVRYLCYFAIDHDIGNEAEWLPEVSVLNNLISRGLPTLAPIHIERFLAEMTGLIRVGEEGEAGVTGEISAQLTEPFGLIRSKLEQALCIYAPGCEVGPTPGFELPEGEDIPNEQAFLQGPLSQLLGPAGVQALARQRPISTLLREGKAPFAGQRVDFCLEFPGNKPPLPQGVIFELDGPEHRLNPQRMLDGKRDTAVKTEGWLVCRRLNEEIHLPIPAKDPVVEGLKKHPYFQLFKAHVSSPLRTDPLGWRVLNLVIAPLAIARIQKVLVEAIRGGLLPLDAERWRIAVVERDGPCAKPAIEDFQQWLNHLVDLYRPGSHCPSIELLTIPTWKNTVSVELPKGWETADLLLDVSVLMRHGVCNRTVDESLYQVQTQHRVSIRSLYYRTTARVLGFGGILRLHATEEEAKVPLRFFLANIFRKTDFRECQLDIIVRTLKGRSVIALLPTGAGKSLTYQMAALLQNGMSMVIDPIRSLMKDQVDELKKLGIDSAVFINSTLTTQERRQNTRWMQRGFFKFIFISPERLLIREFRDALASLNGGFFCFGVVDEAHCVSEWGHDFRTAYLRTSANLRRFCKSHEEGVQILALTGTASHEVLGDVKRELEFERTEADIITPARMEREELHFRIISLDPYPDLPVNLPFQKMSGRIGLAKQELLLRSLEQIADSFGHDFEAFIEQERGNSATGLVFCPHRRWVHGVENVKNRIEEAYPQIAERFGMYYGSTDDTEFNDFDAVQMQDDFKADKVRVLVCTKAFGMGINKQNVRFTVHLNMPQSLESFYQEAGRAGRDRKESKCWLLYAGPPPHIPQEHSVDWSLMHAFYRNSFRGRDHEERMIFGLLDENRMPGSNAPCILCNHLDEAFGGRFRANPFPRQDAHSLYINDVDRNDLVGVVYLNHLSTRQESHPQAKQILSFASDWLRNHAPPDQNIPIWLSQFIPSESGPGLEEILNRFSSPDECKEAVIPFDNGLVGELAHTLSRDERIWHEGTIFKAYEFAFNKESFLQHLLSEYQKTGKSAVITPDQRDAVYRLFPLLRVPSQTFRAVYRLCILGAIKDYTYDYNSKTVTVLLQRQPEGGYLQHLKDYVSRYVSRRDAETIFERAVAANQPTELRKCIHVLLEFIYERIASKRLEALNTIERTVKAGVRDPKVFTEQVNLYFDSRYTADLRSLFREYMPDAVFEFLKSIRGEPHEVAHLLGSCNRLLDENPENAALRALRAYAYALSPTHDDQFARNDIELCMQRLETEFHWNREQKLRFLLRLADHVREADDSAAAPFFAVLVRDHTTWLRTFNNGLDEGNIHAGNR